MADVIPLERLPFKDCEFTPISPTSSSRMDGRRTETQSFGTPYWTVRYTTEWMTPKQYGLFDSFIMKADARGAPFLAYDVFRPRPIAMDQGAPLSGTKAGGGAFNGDVSFSSVTATTLSITGLPAGFVFSPGDYIEVRKSALVRSLHRIVESATANSSGAVTVTIMYQLDTQNFNASCTGHLEKPSCVMMIDPGSVQSPKSWGTREGSFAATEVFFS